MQGAVLYGPRDVRFEERPDPTIIKPTDAIIRIAATCVCGSDLWPYRGIEPITQPQPMGHEYVGIVEEVGGQVAHIKPGQFVVGSFFASDNTCPICRAGFQSRCVHSEPIGAEGAQAPLLRVPLADGTLVARPSRPGPRTVAEAVASTPKETPCRSPETTSTPTPARATGSPVRCTSTPLRSHQTDHG
jgi:threonine dehydrogenase-like Zn-dependent dehydrogenase